MIILGIDPGTARTGWGIIKSYSNNGRRILKLVGYDCIETPKETEMPQRLVMLNQQLRKLLKREKPDLVVIEQLFFGANSKTAMTVGQARGVIIMTAASLGLPIKEYQGLSVKLALTGYGRAKKKEIQEVVKTALGLAKIPKPDDAADALGVAICHVYKG